MIAGSSGPRRGSSRSFQGIANRQLALTLTAATAWLLLLRLISRDCIRQTRGSCQGASHNRKRSRCTTSIIADVFPLASDSRPLGIDQASTPRGLVGSGRCKVKEAERLDESCDAACRERGWESMRAVVQRVSRAEVRVAGEI